MPDLSFLQSTFAGHLRAAGEHAGAAQVFAGDAAAIARGLAIYRANVAASAARALGAAYPVVRQLVGDEFFGGLTRAFQREAPSTSGDLNEYSQGFPAFLAAFPHAQPLPYLPDLARLEWRVHLACGAADGPDWDPTTLAAVEPERQSDIRFAWAPGTALVESPHPIVRLWTIHQPGHDSGQGSFDVAWDVAERALVARDGFAVTVAALAAGDAAFVTRSLAGGTLGQAAGDALAADPAFDLGPLLGRLAGARLLRGFTLKEPDPSCSNP